MLNVICLSGRMVHDPEVKYTPNGAAVTTFAIAVERNRAGQDGKRPVDYIDVVAWQKTAEFVGKYFRKGAMVTVDGSLQTRSYEDKDGKKRKVFEVLADHVHFGGAKNEATRENVGDADDSQFIAQPAQAQQTSAFTAVDDLDLPF